MREEQHPPKPARRSFSWTSGVLGARSIVQRGVGHAAAAFHKAAVRLKQTQAGNGSGARSPATYALSGSSKLRSCSRSSGVSSWPCEAAACWAAAATTSSSGPMIVSWQSLSLSKRRQSAMNRFNFPPLTSSEADGPTAEDPKSTAGLEQPRTLSSNVAAGFGCPRASSASGRRSAFCNARITPAPPLVCPDADARAARYAARSELEPRRRRRGARRAGAGNALPERSAAA